jgi:hypothetical protein
LIKHDITSANKGHVHRQALVLQSKSKVDLEVRGNKLSNAILWKGCSNDRWSFVTIREKNPEKRWLIKKNFRSSYLFNEG